MTDSTKGAVWHLQTPEALQDFASRLAPFLSASDFIGLRGDLGAGKTTFAQGLLKALGIEKGVTSPTYQLVHAHSAGVRTVYHCDFYRIGPFEEEDIGFREMCETGAVVAEWPEMLRCALPENRLEVRIVEENDGRQVSLIGFGAWQRKLHRFREICSFLAPLGWKEAACVAIKGDASARLFSRLGGSRGTAMLMDWPPLPDGPPIRDGKPYCDIAHLAREGEPFLAVSNWLRNEAGLSAPAVFSGDRDRGLYLVEDLGDAVFGQLVAEGKPLEPLYALAVDGLLALRASNPPQILPGHYGAYSVPEFDREAFEIEIDLLIEWYFKLSGETESRSRRADSFLAAWSPLLDWLQDEPKSLILRDYHSPNLLLCPERDDLRRLGVIDFQDALWGHPAYDLVSLLQDARLDVPDESEAALFARYCDAAEKADARFDRGAFAKAYAILGAQRNTKILGIFARLSLRDGKHGYLAHLPRIARYLLKNLSHPDLKPLKAWYEDHLKILLSAGESPAVSA
jgi:tRNA threonylcarbamoyl adenosine modification protein YjeE